MGLTGHLPHQLFDESKKVKGNGARDYFSRYKGIEKLLEKRKTTYTDKIGSDINIFLYCRYSTGC